MPSPSPCHEIVRPWHCHAHNNITTPSACHCHALATPLPRNSRGIAMQLSRQSHCACARKRSLCWTSATPRRNALLTLRRHYVRARFPPSGCARLISQSNPNVWPAYADRAFAVADANDAMPVHKADGNGVKKGRRHCHASALPLPCHRHAIAAP